MQDPARCENNKASAQEIIDVFVPKLISSLRWNTGETVLDYGCGAGSTGFKCILPKVEEFQSKMYSVDVSAKMLAFAEENYPHELITYGVGDILDKFPFENVKFDKIFAVNVFHYIRDMKKALAGFHKILKPGGKIGFITIPANYILFQAYQKLAANPTWKQYMEEYDSFYPIWSKFAEGQEESGMKELMESSGFRVSTVEFLHRNYHFQSTDSFLDIVLALNPCLDHIPMELHGAFKEEIKEIFTRADGVSLDSKTVDVKYQLCWGVVVKVEKVEQFDSNSNS
ncbi:Juvenile hormone acid O-methyltransferase [Orchesella cincta]|uniref:Juvenile hormone acid O-methyltransferase n=1 Tax=Orchesella cincta TaxID=48709 RepID=A0A1D2ML21_ORCCI|nr:Juvenile hormone acid O-methyltransferase [Orchesella cincta]